MWSNECLWVRHKICNSKCCHLNFSSGKIPKCGWEAALTLAKLNNIGSTLFWTSIPMWRQNEQQKSFPFSEIAASMCGQSSLDGPYPPYVQAAISEGQELKKIFDAKFVFTWAQRFKKVYKQHCSILLGLEQPPSHMCFESTIRCKMKKNPDTRDWHTLRNTSNF